MECEFVEPPPKQFQSLCFICQLVLREPHIVSCCGDSFCETCIGHIQRDGKPCPQCNETGFTTVANGGLKRALNKFQVRCTHRELGCEWVGEMGKLEQHLNTDPQPEHQLEGCPFTSVECVLCKDHMRRRLIAGHQNERCPKRPYTCKYCEQYESTFEDVVDHWAECRNQLLPCPNNCRPSKSDIKRQDLKRHMKKECPLTVVECDFHYVGCGVKRPRKDMAVHFENDSKAHVSLLAADNQRLAKQLLKQDEKKQQLRQQNIELSNRIDQQQRDHQELAAKVAVLTRGLQEKQGLRERSLVVPVDIKMTGYKELKDGNTIWCGPPFYTHMCGYKMCLKVYANGCGNGKGTHVSMFTCLMCGEFDSDLNRPFRGNVTIKLLNQLEDKNHFTVTTDYRDASPDNAGRVTVGYGRFIKHSQLNYHTYEYLKDDTLIFKVFFVKKPKK